MGLKKIKKIEKLMQKGCDILGSKYSIIGGAMTWISNSHLVAAMSDAGIFGVLASGAMDGDLLKNEIAATKNLITNGRSFGVNIIMANPQLHNLIDVCAAEKVSHVVLAGGMPDKQLIDKIHSLGMQVLSFAPALSIAKRLFKHGVDAVVIEGNEAGGHVGPISTMVLIQDVLLNMQGYPIFVAGGILKGEVIASLLMMGAVGCQLGTVFACARESTAHQNFKNLLCKSNGRSAITPPQIDKKFPVSLVRAIENVATEEFITKQKDVIAKYNSEDVSLEEGRLLLEHFWSGALRRAVQDGDVERGSIMAGQIVEIVREERSVRDIVQTALMEAESYIGSIEEKLRD